MDPGLGATSHESMPLGVADIYTRVIRASSVSVNSSITLDFRANFEACPNAWPPNRAGTQREAEPVGYTP